MAPIATSARAEKWRLGIAPPLIQPGRDRALDFGLGWQCACAPSPGVGRLPAPRRGKYSAKSPLIFPPMSACSAAIRPTTILEPSRLARRLGVALTIAS